MDGRMLPTARRLTRWVRDQGVSAGYLWVVDVLKRVSEDRLHRWLGHGMGKTTGHEPEALREWTRTLEATFVEVEGATGVSVPARAVLAGPESTPPVAQCWVDGPRAGVYLSAFRYAAHAVSARHAPVIRDHHASADERIVCGLLEDAVLTAAKQAWLRRLWERPAGTLVVVELVLSQWERVQSALVLHEACVLAQQYGHRVIAHVRSPQSEVALTANGLEQALALPEYFDFAFIRTALRGTVTAAGEFCEGLPLGAPDGSRQGGPGQNGRKSGGGDPVMPAERRRMAAPVSAEVRRVQEDGQDRRAQRVQAGPERTRAWREAQLAKAAGAMGPEGWGERVTFVKAVTPAGTAEPVIPVPRSIREVLRPTSARALAGIVLVGGRPGRSERCELLKSILNWTGGGEVALVLPAYRFGAAKHYLTMQDEAGIERVRSRAFAHLPLYSCFEAAYAAGHRRMMVEYDCSAYSAATADFVREHLDEVCVIAAVDEVDAERAFLRMTAGDWAAMDTLIGIVSWVHTPYGAFTDAFISQNRLVPEMRFESAAQAVRGGRRLRWESLAVALLDGEKLPARQLLCVLRDGGVVSGREFELLRCTPDPVALKLFLMERMLNRVSEPGLQIATQGRFGPRRVESGFRHDPSRSHRTFGRGEKKSG
jgi:hypothetical protein